MFHCTPFYNFRVLSARWGTILTRFRTLFYILAHLPSLPSIPNTDAVQHKRKPDAALPKNFSIWENKKLVRKNLLFGLMVAIRSLRSGEIFFLLCILQWWEEGVIQCSSIPFLSSHKTVKLHPRLRFNSLKSSTSHRFPNKSSVTHF